MTVFDFINAAVFGNSIGLLSWKELREAAEKISTHGCGCRPCVGQCQSQEALKIWQEESVSLLSDILKRIKEASNG